MEGSYEKNTLHNKLINNTIFQYCGYIWMLLMGLLITPYIINNIGIKDFGIYAILLALFRYFELLDLGIESAIIKNISNLKSLSKKKIISEYVSTSIFIQSVIFLVAIFSSIILVNGLMNIFFSGSAEHKRYFVLIMLAISAGALKNLFNVFRGVVMGMQRMGVSNIIETLATIPFILSIVIFFNMDYGLEGLMISRLVLVLVSGIGMLVAFKYIDNETEIGFGYIRKDVLKSLLSFGGKLQISKLSQLASFQLDKILIGFFLNASFAGLYEIGAKLATILRHIPLIMISAVVPSVAEIHTHGDMQTIKSLFLRGTKYLIYMWLPLLLFTQIFANDIIRAWLGREYLNAGLALRFLSIGYFLNLLSGMASATSIGMGKPEMEMRVGVVVLILNTTLSLFLVLTFGFKGVLFGTAVSLGIGSFYYFLLFNKIIKISFRDILELSGYPFLIAISSIFLSILIENGFALFMNFSSAITQERVNIIINGIVFTISYFTCLWKTGQIDEFEKKVILEKIKTLLSNKSQHSTLK